MKASPRASPEANERQTKGVSITVASGVNVFGANYHSNPLNVLNVEIGNKMRNSKYGQIVRVLNTRM